MAETLKEPGTSGYQADSPLRMPLVALAAVLLLAAGVRLYELDRNPLWYDEVMYAEVCKTFQPDVASSQALRMEPAFYLLLWAWEQISHNDAWIRLHSVLAGWLTVALGVMMGRRMAGCRGGILSGLILALAPLLVFYSRDAKMYSWVTLLSLSSAYCAIRYSDPDGRKPHLAGYLISAVLLFYAHELSAIFLTALLVLHALIFLRSWRKTIVWGVMQAIVAISCAPYLMLMASQAREMRAFMFWAPPPTAQSLWITLGNLFTGYSTVEWMRIAAIAVYGLFVLFGLALGHPHRKYVAFFILLGITNVLGIFMLSRLAPWSLYVDRYMIASTAFFLLAAIPGLASLHWRAAGIAGLLAILALDTCFLRDLYEYRLPPDPAKRLGVYHTCNARSIGNVLRKKALPGDMVWHMNEETYAPVRWYVPEVQHRMVEFNGELSERLALFASPANLRINNFQISSVETAQAKTRRVWLVLPEYNPPAYTRYCAVLAWLDERAKRLYSERFDGRFASVSLYLYEFVPEPSRTPPSPASRMPLFGDLPNGAQGPAGYIETNITRDLSFTVLNRSAGPQQVFCQAVPADYLCGASGFNRVQENSRWGLQLYRDRNSCRWAWYGRFGINRETVDPLEYPLMVSPGIYDVFMERQVTSRPGGPAAPIRIHIGNAICEVQGATRAQQEGWQWIHAGTVQLDEMIRKVMIEPARVDLNIENSPVFSQVVLLKHQGGNTGPPASPVFAQNSFSLGAHETNSLSLKPAIACEHVAVILSTETFSTVISTTMSEIPIGTLTGKPL